MLRLMLTAHPDLCVPPESMFFVQLADRYEAGLSSDEDVRSFLDTLYENQKFSEWGVDRPALRTRLTEAVYCSYAEAVSTVYETYQETQDPTAIRWGDKNPDYVYQIPAIFTHFPEARVIHLVRDVRAVYNSYRSKAVLENWSQLDPNRLIQSVTQQWRQCGRVRRTYGEDPRVTHVFYEDLVAQPRPALQALCRDVGLSFSEDMIRFYRKNEDEHLVPSHRREWHKKTFQPVDEGRATAWKRELSRSEIEALEVLNQADMHDFGYQTVTTAPRPRGQFLIFRKRVSAAVYRSARRASSLLRRIKSSISAAS